MDSTQLSVETDSTEVIADRRRPGRIDNVSPELLPLMRRSDLAAAGRSIAAEPELIESAGQSEELDPEGDAAAPARGIVFGLVLSVPIWAGIWLLLRCLF